MLIAGVDEVGRGPLVGAVVAAAVILPEPHNIDNLKDSKKLSAKERDKLFDIICDRACAWSIAEASPQEIDQINILQASLLAMQRAVQQLDIKPDLVLVDGNRPPTLDIRTECIIKGDAKIAAISAAAIIAKVYRDKQMYALDAQFPEYGFAKHKGYPTPEHLAALEEYGPIPEQHRMSFGPVARCLADTVS